MAKIHDKTDIVAKNFDRAASFIRSAADQGADIAILPEYHLSAWEPESKGFHESSKDAAGYLKRYCSLARELRIAIVPGTIIELSKENGNLLNTCYFISAEGEVLSRYVKKNLWHPERPHLEADSARPHAAFDTPWGRFGLLICWDLAFPEATRALVADGARVVICPAYWDNVETGPTAAVNPESEGLFLATVPTARAIENTCAFVLVNTGGPPALEQGKLDSKWLGGSHVAMPLQGPIQQLGKREDMTVVEVDLGVLDVAEEAYKVRMDMEKDEWHYAYALGNKPNQD